MIEEEATVVALEGDHALVETLRKSSCGGCSARAGCGTALLAKVFGNRRTSLRVVNKVQAQTGDGVIVGLSERALILGSLLIYISPLVAMILGAVIGRWLGVHVSAFPAETVSIIGGLLGLAAGLFGMNRIGRALGIKGAFQAVILRVRPTVAVPVASLQEKSLES